MSSVGKLCGKIGVISSAQMFDANKPRYNAWACGHGIIGDTKYNRRKEERNFKRCCGKESFNDYQPDSACH